jgi:hypothetical protein
MCLRIVIRKKYEENKFASLMSLKKGIGSGVGSGSVIQRWGSGSAPKFQGSPALGEMGKIQLTFNAPFNPCLSLVFLRVSMTVSHHCILNS